MLVSAVQFSNIPCITFFLIFGNVTETRLVQFENVFFPIDVTLLGTTTLTNPVLLKAYSPIVSSVFGSAISVRDVQLLNAEFPISVTSGIVILLSDVQLLKPFDGISFTVDGIDTLLRFLQP